MSLDIRLCRTVPTEGWKTELAKYNVHLFQVIDWLTADACKGQAAAAAAALSVASMSSFTPVTDVDAAASSVPTSTGSEVTAPSSASDERRQTPGDQVDTPHVHSSVDHHEVCDTYN